MIEKWMQNLRAFSYALEQLSLLLYFRNKKYETSRGYQPNNWILTETRKISFQEK